MRIVVDAMGGDYAPDVNIQGALAALEESRGLHLILVGDKDIIRKKLQEYQGKESRRLTIQHAEEVITMEDVASVAIRRKKGSSIHVGLDLVKEKQADAFISAGNSGAVMACALLKLGRVSEVERPAIVVRLPTAQGHVSLLDAGANVDCKPSHLVQFAEMGSLYAQFVTGIAIPKVGLLSNASESHKGNDLTRETHELLKGKGKIHYLGYIEGHDLFRGKADVVVCDGFVGNVILKTAEGLAETCFEWFRHEIKKDLAGLLGVFLLRSLLKNFKSKFDYQPYGAAPLLGIDGLVFISHGASSDVAIRNGILTAQKAGAENFLEKIRGNIGSAEPSPPVREAN